MIAQAEKVRATIHIGISLIASTGPATVPAAKKRAPHTIVANIRQNPALTLFYLSAEPTPTVL